MKTDLEIMFKVLELIREIKEEEEEVAEPGSDISGYHSDSDSAIMMSGNSPFVSKNARSNFLLRSGKKKTRINVEQIFISKFHILQCA